MNDLPLEIFIQILDYCIEEYYPSLLLVCKQWHEQLLSYYGPKPIVSLSHFGLQTGVVRKLIAENDLSETRSLSFKYCSFLNSTDFETFARNDFRCLKKLNLKACKLFDDNCVHFISTLPNLTSLNLSGCDKLTEKGIFKLIFANTKLKNLNLRSTNANLDFPTDSLDSLDNRISPSSLSLQILKYENIHQRNVIGRHFAFISSYCKDLQVLFFTFHNAYLDYIRLGIDLENLIKHCSKLRVLYFEAEYHRDLVLLLESFADAHSKILKFYFNSKVIGNRNYIQSEEQENYNSVNNNEVDECSRYNPDLKLMLEYK